MDFTQLSADLESQPIQGWLHSGERLDVSLISHVWENLYVGGCIHGTDLGDFFSHVFSLYPWERYKVAPETKVLETKMYDSTAGVDEETIIHVADLVTNALDEGGNVLVHCQAGINRSNLIAATVLMNKGFSSQEAVDLLREKRSPLVLANQTFLEYLLSL